MIAENQNGGRDMNNGENLKNYTCCDSDLQKVVGGESEDTSVLRPHRKLREDERYCTGCMRTGHVGDTCVCGGVYTRATPIC